MSIKLSEVAEKQINEIQYALGCSRPKAISHALETMNAFEQITDDQILNWLDTNHKEKLHDWEVGNEGKRAKLSSN
jgi:predicted transcriptional regulator